MTLTSLPCAAAVAATVAMSVTTGATAQTTATDPRHPATTSAQTTPEPRDAPGQGQRARPSSAGMAHPGMMGQGMMGGMMQPGMMGTRGHMIKIVFAFADTDGDERLFFEEITAIHRRIFDKVDANKDGKITSEEVQAFMRE